MPVTQTQKCAFIPVTVTVTVTVPVINAELKKLAPAPPSGFPKVSSFKQLPRSMRRGGFIFRSLQILTCWWDPRHFKACHSARVIMDSCACNCASRLWEPWRKVIIHVSSLDVAELNFGDRDRDCLVMFSLTSNGERLICLFEPFKRSCGRYSNV
jgi:hypothetical protein